MSLFFETLYIKDQNIRNLELHNKRLNKTIKDMFNINANIDLSNFVKLKSKKAHRVKVIYNKEIQKIEIYPILKREFKDFKIIKSDITYSYKYLNREKIDNLFKKRGSCDDIIIVDKNGFIKDSSIANISLLIDNVWITPKKPLLKGTMREYLLKNKIIKEFDVKIEDIKKANKIALSNAILGFYIIDEFKIEDI